MSSSTTQELRDLLGSYRFFAEMQRLSSKAAQGDSEAIETLDDMLRECSQDPDWRVQSRWCAAAVRALVAAGTEQARARVVEYVRDLPEETSYGMVELLGGLLPGFGRDVLPDVRELVKSPSVPARAAAVQALCNFYLEGQLPASEVDFLREVIRSYEPDRYLTQQLFELVQPGAADAAAGEDELELLLEDVIVETRD